MKKYIVILLCSCFYFIDAQTYSNVHWGNAYGFGGAPASMLFNSDTLITCSFDDHVFGQIIFRSFRRDGSLIDSSTFSWATDTNIYTVPIRNNSLTKLNINEFISLNDLFYFGDSSTTQIIKLNSKLDTLKTYVLDTLPTKSNFSFDVLVEDTAITVLGQYVLPNKKLSLYIARFDTALNLQWYKTIADFKPFVNQYFNGYYPYRLRRVGNNYYITGRCLYTTHSVEGFLVKTDLQGNKIWDKRYQYQSYNGLFPDFIEINNDSLFTTYVFNSKTIGNTSYNKVQFLIHDSSFTVLKDTVYPEEEVIYLLNQISKSNDGNILLVGHFDQGGTKSVVWKLDKNLNTVWRRVYYYGDYEDESWLYNIGQWPDGGIMATGTYFNRYQNPTNKNMYLWLLSLDTNGCLDPNNCGSGIGVIEWALPGQGIKVYPNPATEFVNIELSLPTLQNTTATAKLYNTAGQVVLLTDVEINHGKTQINLTTSSLMAGQYVLELKTATHLFFEKIIIE